jgi:hypothetical protein
MKKLLTSARTTAFILLTCFCDSCDSGKNFPLNNPSLGTLTAKMNGGDWHKTYKNAYQVIQCTDVKPSTALPCNEDHLDLLSELYSSEGYLRQQLYFIKIPKSVGKHRIIASIPSHCNELDPAYGEFYTIIQDGCAVGDIYNTLKGEDNFVQIEQFDKKTGEIKGTFQLTLVIEKRGVEPMLPDTLRFTNGRFHTRILDL